MAVEQAYQICRKVSKLQGIPDKNRFEAITPVQNKPMNYQSQDISFENRILYER
jgi:hypothetical protein